MFVEEFIATTTHFIENHQNWAVVIIFILAFGESLAVISILLPATTVLIATGALIGSDLLPFFPIWISASVGAILGDSLSYWLGRNYQEQITSSWPLKNQKRLLIRGELFFKKFGTFSIFIGRFFGPLRAVVPLIAGTLLMDKIKFNVSNIISAPIWAFVILAPGMFGIQWLEQLLN